MVGLCFEAGCEGYKAARFEFHFLPLQREVILLSALLFYLTFFSYEFLVDHHFLCPVNMRLFLFVSFLVH